MTENKAGKTGPKRHFARYVGGYTVKHSGRLKKIVPFFFAPGTWVEIPLDPYWQCKSCNRSIRKGFLREGPHGRRLGPGEVTQAMNPTPAGRPRFCGSERRYVVTVMGTTPKPEYSICESEKFTDTVQRRFFKMKAKMNDTWEYKIE